VASRTAEAVEVIRQLLFPWNVSFTSLDDAEIIIAYKQKPLETKNTIVIPSDSHFFMEWAKDAKLGVLRKNGERVCVSVSQKMVLTVTPRILYHYDGSVESTTGNMTAPQITSKENLVVLTLDVLKEYNRILDETLNVEKSKIYGLLTGLPIPYTMAPKRLRDMLMGSHARSKDLSFRDRLPLDALRFILSQAIEKLSKKKLPNRKWNGKKFACVVTHDIDTRKGLQMAKHLKKVEEKYNIPSAWYIPSKHYKLDHETIKELANFGEIGSHDTRHDGKLSQLPKRKLIERLKEAKQTLEKIIDCSVEGFRAPLLQHSYEIIQALHETGYAYDTSIPTWEPKHPYTMKPHGIGTIYPFKINGVVEIPVTFPQDHQMIHYLGMNPRQTVEAWTKLMKETEEIGGLCVFLTHPDYELTSLENQSVYEDLLNIIAGNDEAYVALPKSLVSSQERL
jgi:peptidoglycan/xylan/chitin deacetylase (PgdA/CDA1 family)